MNSASRCIHTTVSGLQRLFSQTRAFFLSSRTVLALIVLLLLAVVVAAFIPQRVSASAQEIAAWRQQYADWVTFAELAALDRVYTSPWFLLLLQLLLISLLFSLAAQGQLAWKRTFGPGTVPAGPWIPVSFSKPELGVILRRHGFFRIHTGGAVIRYVKHPWGLWGNFFLHLGFVLVICASLLLAATQQYGVLHLYEGETHQPHGPWLDEEHGLWVDPLLLSFAVRLDQVTPDYWPGGELRQLRSSLSIVKPSGETVRHQLAINQPLSLPSGRIYQGGDYGAAFFLVIRDRQGRSFPTIFQLPHPAEGSGASYGNFSVEGIPFLFKAKYLVGATDSSPATEEPRLVVRLFDGNRMAGEVSFGQGRRADLGPYDLVVMHVAFWTSIIFSRVHGMAGVFAGFFLIVFGAGFAYFFPPREFYVVRDQRNSCGVKWRATRFPGFFEEECQEIFTELRKGREIA